MLVSLRAATSIRSAKESLLLSEIFTALWNSLIPASKHYSAVVTDRKEAQKPPLLTAVTQDVSCPELWMPGHKTPACILKCRNPWGTLTELQHAPTLNGGWAGGWYHSFITILLWDEWWAGFQLPCNNFENTDNNHTFWNFFGLFFIGDGNNWEQFSLPGKWGGVGVGLGGSSSDPDHSP